MCYTTGSHLSSLLTISSVKLSLCGVVRHLPRVFESYDGRSKFDSVLHTENDDVSYGFSAI